MNQNILRAKSKFIVLLVVFIVMQCVMLLVLSHLVENMANTQSFDEQTTTTIKRIVLVGIIILSIIVDTVLYMKKIYRLNLMANIEPVFGKVEDFIIYSYGRENGKARLEFKVSPLIRGLKDNKLYLTYGNYSVSWYTTIEVRNQAALICKEIIRSDGTSVKKGDDVAFYVIKTLNMEIKEDRKKYWFKLNGKKVKLMSRNSEMEINMLKNTTFFEGAVDVEKLLN